MPIPQFLGDSYLDKINLRQTRSILFFNLGTGFVWERIGDWESPLDPESNDNAKSKAKWSQYHMGHVGYGPDKAPDTLGKSLSVPTIRCNLSTATHGEKMHKWIILVAEQRIWVVDLGGLVFKNLQCIAGMIYLCTSLPWACSGQVATDGWNDHVFP